jgi:hypothetical protein
VSSNGAENTESHTQLTIDEKKAVLKMAGVLISTQWNGLHVAQPPELQPLTIAHSHDDCVFKAYNRYILRITSWRN